MLNRKNKKNVPLLLILLISFIGVSARVDSSGINGIINTHDSLTISSVKDSSSTEIDENSLIEPEIPLHASMDAFIDDYTDEHGDLFEKMLESKSSYFKTIDKIFLDQGIPVELKYVAVIESKLKTNARSGVGAVGLWQFMPATAKTYGLKITSKYDERQNLWKSTGAAAKYMKSLYKYFEDWLLVVAAYNSGPGPIFTAIKKSGSRNFWKLQYFLPKETRLHVKRFIATHYYFEGKGSLVTLGKAESDKYLNALEEYKAKLNELNDENSSNNEDSNSTPQQLIAITQNENDLNLIMKK